jgi:O-antigen ligase
MAAWVLVRGGNVWSLDPAPQLFIAAAAVPLIQAGAGVYVLAGEAWIVALSLLGLAFTMAVAREAQQVAPLRLSDMLFASLAVAALLSAGLALYQWLEHDWLGDLVPFPRYAGRVSANVGQPNNLATLLCWGVVAIWWFFARGAIRGRTAFLCALALLMGAAMTRSRTGWVEVTMLAGAALYARQKTRSGPHVPAVLALSLAFALTVIGLSQFGQALPGEAPASAPEVTSIGKRPQIWHLALDEIAQRPWGGYGWNQGLVAHMGLAERYPDLRVAVQHAHSLPLDLLVWNGVPLGLLMIGAIAWWAVAQWRACRSEPQRLLLLALALFALHAVVELPHAYLFFLVPVAMMMGTLNALSGAADGPRVPRAVVAMSTAALAVAVAVAVNDYRDLEANMLRLKLRAAHIHNPNPTPMERPVLLTFMQTALERLYAEPSKDMPAAELALLKRTLDRYPAIDAFMRYAQTSALQGDANEARWALERICLLNNTSHCQAALKEWSELSKQMPELASVVPPSPK